MGGPLRILDLMAESTILSEVVHVCDDCGRGLTLKDEWRQTYGFVRCSDCHENATAKSQESE